MKVTEAEFVQGFIRMCDDGYALGFHERNGGNASYRMKPEEVEQVKDQLIKNLQTSEQKFLTLQENIS